MKRRGVFLLTTLLLSVMSSLTLIYSQHSFIKLKEWRSGKAVNRVTLNGSSEYLFERSPLARGKLSLSKYYGYHLVELYEPRSFESLNLDFWLNDPLAWLDVIFSDDKNKSIIFRIGGAGDKGFVRVYSRTAEGPFQKLREAQTPLAESKKSHLRIQRANDWAEIFIGDASVAKLQHNFLANSQMRISFRSGPCCTTIDELRLHSHGHLIFAESFNPRGPFLTFLVSHFIFFSLLFLTLGQLKFLGTPAFLSTQVLVFFLIYFSFDYFIWTERPYFAHAKTFVTGEHQQNFFEKTRVKISDALFKIYGAETNRWQIQGSQYPSRPAVVEGYFCKDTCKTIEGPSDVKDVWEKTGDQCFWFLTLGGSQAHGAGASDWETTYFHQLQKRIRKKRPKSCFISVNLATSGATLSILLQKLEAKYPFLKPDLTLALIGINGDPEHFTPYALPFLKLLKDRSKALAVVSAVTPEDNWYLLAKRKEMKRVSQELKAPYLPLHEKIRGTGINADDWLWWDNCCHLTDSGQRWVAEEIYSFLEPHL